MKQHRPKLWATVVVTALISCINPAGAQTVQRAPEPSATGCASWSPPWGGSEEPGAPRPMDVKPIRSPPPDYPRTARLIGLEGLVLIKVHVAPDGTPLAARVEQSSRHAWLDDAACAVMALWRFSPQQAAFVAVIPFNFKLRRAPSPPTNVPVRRIDEKPESASHD